MTQARRFEELSVDHEGKELPELIQVETAVRPLAKLTADDEPRRTILTASIGAPTSAQ